MQTNFSTSFTTAQSAQKVFDAFNHVCGWWTQNTEGNNEKTGYVFTVRFGETWMTMEVTEIIPGKKVEWLVTASHKNWVKGNKQEWTGTRIVLGIEEKNGQTRVQLTHNGLVPALECYGGCAGAWTGYVQDSLKKLVETGAGEPS